MMSSACACERSYLLSAASAAAANIRIEPEIRIAVRIPIFHYSPVFTIILTTRLGWRFPEAGSLPQNSLRDGQPLHGAGAFIDSADFGIAVQLFDRVILSESHAAEDLDGSRGYSLGHL